MEVTPDTVLHFWFPAPPINPQALTASVALWFQPKAEQDEQMRSRFGQAVHRALAGKLDGWTASSEGRLALILLLDQFTRCVFRGTPQAFSGDAAALALASNAIDQGLDRPLRGLQRQFFYMPFQHSEDIATQNRSVELFRQLAREAGDDVRPVLDEAVGYAELHRDIVARFGRFPHRNLILGRANTREENEYLAADAPTFGQ